MLGEQRITVERRTSAGLSDGVWQDATVSTFTITASVQPYEPSETQLLPEGMRTASLQKMYTKSSLRPVELFDTEADVVQYAGARWRVHRLSPYDEGVGQILWHTKYQIQRIAEDE